MGLPILTGCYSSYAEKIREKMTMQAVCGADCGNCGYGKERLCRGCTVSKGCPFGKQCFLYQYIKVGGTKHYEQFKKQLLDEFHSLNIPGMPEIHELYAMNGSYVNLAYPMPNGTLVKLLDDNQIYLCNQVECNFSDGQTHRYYGLVAGMDFLMVSEYGANCADPELLVYRKR